MSGRSWLIRGGTLLPMDPAAPEGVGDVLVQDGRIAAVGAVPALPPGTQVLDAEGCVVMPGLVQGHVHLCQTLCRGQADDLPLLEWLRRRVWPYEAALCERSIAAAARLGCAELLLSGTTAILDMGTVHHQDALSAAVAATGMRAVLGKAMMDFGEDPTIPPGLRETTAASLTESDALARRWHGAAEGRLRYAYAPRFALSCTETLLREVAERVEASGPAGPRLHTHAAEQREEVDLVRVRFGADNITALSRLGVAGPKVVLAHCVHVDEAQRALIAAGGSHVAHCPSSNLKLGSGLAPICEMLDLGINVALGADGAPCNNNLDAMLELRLSALLQKGRLGPQALPARRALQLATVGGARALGLSDETGALRPGLRADIVILDPRAPHALPFADPCSLVVYALRGGDVRDVLVDGRLLVRDRALTEQTGLVDREALLAEAGEQARRVALRADI
jgi:5-methylthioadenosine/S-adenosylhomocysteine deaminase